MSNEARANHEKLLYRSQDEARGKREDFSNEPLGNRGKLYTEPRANHEYFSNEQLVARIQAGENEADNMLLLWQQTKRFISMLAKKYIGHAEIEDLEQEGYLALCNAVEKYDPDKGVTFINYAAYWMRQYMTRYIQNYGRCVRIPVHAQEDITKYKSLMSHAELQLGRKLKESEISHYLYVSQDKVRQIQKDCCMGQIQSLDTPLKGAEDLTLCDTVPAADNQVEDRIRVLDEQQMSQALWEAVGELEEQQRKVITYRFRDNLTIKATGEVMDITIERVRQLQSKGLRLLRNTKRNSGFQGYYEEYIQATCYRHVSVREFNHSWYSEVEREVLG